METETDFWGVAFGIGVHVIAAVVVICVIVGVAPWWFLL